MNKRHYSFFGWCFQPQHPLPCRSRIEPIGIGVGKNLETVELLLDIYAHPVVEANQSIWPQN
jgi:hypothetical protein